MSELKRDKGEFKVRNQIDGQGISVKRIQRQKIVNRGEEARFGYGENDSETKDRYDGESMSFLSPPSRQPGGQSLFSKGEINNSGNKSS